ncbi:MAG: hypothetical protein IPF96_17940 [Rhodobacter sp.]|nr:hypothetical protein [Rhodobacter sp.]
MTCDFDGQVVELQIRDAIMNRFSIFGIRKLNARDEAVHGKGKLDLRLIFATEPTRIRRPAYSPPKQKSQCYGTLYESLTAGSTVADDQPLVSSEMPSVVGGDLGNQGNRLFQTNWHKPAPA